MDKFKPFSKEDEIRHVDVGPSHTVILGAGASIAASLYQPKEFPKRLPSMANLVEIIGLGDLVDQLSPDLRKNNFEDLYDSISGSAKWNHIKLEIEKSVYKYFSSMKLPDKPTIYDYLILSLRPKDMIATFNWDPFLYQAFCRNDHIADRPHVAFLHGNVAIGYCKDNGDWGPAGWRSKATGKLFKPTKLLFPVSKKDYNTDEFLKFQWSLAQKYLSKSSIVTVFGYSAPKTDVEAMALLKSAWGKVQERNMEQFEFIDIRQEDELIKSWTDFIHTHHYNVESNFFESSIGQHPRRTGESYMRTVLPVRIEDAFAEPNPVPNNFPTLQAMWDWYKPLINAENRTRKR